MSKLVHLVSVSGGKDSTALYLLALERGRPFRAVFADTGNEHDATYDFVRELPGKTGGPAIEWVKADFAIHFARKRIFIARHWPRYGVPPDVVQAAIDLMAEPTGNPFLDLCILKGRFPSTRVRFCTDRLKIDPIFQQVERPLLDAGQVVVSWQGVRADESVARSTLPKWQRIQRTSEVMTKAELAAYADKRTYAYRPLLEWKVEDVWRMHEKHGIARNRLYDMGMGRVGCMPCINCRKDELRSIAARFPDHIDRIAQWEDIVAKAARRGNATFFCTTDDPTNNAADDITQETHGIRRRVEWSKTSNGGRQYDLMALADFNTACDAWGACE